ncbi:MAG: hypothetical protein LAO55_05115 [Acidobacteriia bacterium]|nr:hypothetical protein [Terriglobia bacterium]
MKHFAGVCALTVYGSLVLGQTVAVPAKWVGTWALNVKTSTFGTILIPGAPVGFTVGSQTLSIKQTAQEIRLSGETVFSDSNGSHSAHDDNSLSLDGRETVVGAISLSFRRIDDSTFDIVSKAKINNRNFGEVSRFSFSSDGGTLTETKTQTEREVVPEGVDKPRARLLKPPRLFLSLTKSMRSKGPSRRL